MKFKKRGQFAKAVAKKNGLFQENGVLLIRGDFTQKQCDEFNGKKIKDMDKVELEAKARTKGVELDRRKKRDTLTKKVKKLFS